MTPLHNPRHRAALPETLVAEPPLALRHGPKGPKPANGHTHAPANEETRHNEYGRLVASPTTELLTELGDAEKRHIIEHHFTEVMRALGLDLQDDSLGGTPRRVAKMFVNEIFAGLNPENEPEITLFENQYNYHEMLVERDIELHSTCEHHFQPIVGVAHVAYIPRTHVAGLSKLNRAVQHYARRPQVQERLTVQIAEFLKYKLETPDVAVVIDAKHYCVSLRGVEDPCSTTVTASYHGAFRKPDVRAEFLRHTAGK